MSIEKLSETNKHRIQVIPYTQISNEVICHIKDNDAFRVYCYLQSKSQTWKVVKEHLKNICSIGDRKLMQIFSYLHRSNLIQYVQCKDEANKFTKVELHVLNGSNFNINEPFIKNNDEKSDLSTENEKNVTYPQSAHAISAHAENRTCGNAGLLKKDFTKERELQKSESIDQKPTKQKSTPPPIPPSRYHNPHAASYVQRDTMSDDYKNAKRGSMEVAKEFLSRLPIGLRPLRYVESLNL